MTFAKLSAATFSAALLSLSSVCSAHFEPVVSSNPNLLAQNIAGDGVTVTNPKLTSNRFAAGTFGDSIAVISIDTGIVLDTGDIRDTEVGGGPNTTGNTDFGLPGDSQLDAFVAPNKTFDAAVFEFDVTTAQSTLGITYVFASEEYNARIGQAADVLGIFVNGVNCATVKGQPVNINTVNATSNAAQFVDNSKGTRIIQMNGLTVPLECVAAVTPNVPAHIRIALADVGDGLQDSAVMIASGGVHAPGNGPVTTVGPPIASTVQAIEYYHKDFDHYFITAIADEIQKLDNGTFVGWARTGLSFNVFASGAPNAAVCRFFSTAFDPKSSHFYTPFAAECATVKTNPNWQFEGEVFNVDLPVAGECAANRRPLYRLYNNGQGAAPNHRYTTDLSVRAQMMSLGWIPEGDGIGVIACVPM